MYLERGGGCRPGDEDRSALLTFHQRVTLLRSLRSLSLGLPAPALPPSHGERGAEGPAFPPPACTRHQVRAVASDWTFLHLYHKTERVKRA